MTTIQRIKGQPGVAYEVLFVDQHGHLIVALTEWYRLRSALGPTPNQTLPAHALYVRHNQDGYRNLQVFRVSRGDSQSLRAPLPSISRERLNHLLFRQAK